MPFTHLQEQLALALVGNTSNRAKQLRVVKANRIVIHLIRVLSFKLHLGKNYINWFSMKYLIGFIIGMAITTLAYEQETATKVAHEVVVDKVSDGVKEIDYTYYENLYQSSVTVFKDAYDSPTNGALDAYYVQIGAFSKLDNADSFRAEAILEGYLIADIFVETVGDIHRVMIGPFAEKHEAELAIAWASGKNFSGLLLAKKG